MIHISDIANKLKSFLGAKKETTFRIFIRINCFIDVYIVTDNVNADGYQEEFIKSLSSSDNDYYQKDCTNLKIEFYIISLSERNDPFYKNIFSDLTADLIDRGPRYRFDSLLCKHTQKIEPNRAPVITFYSYKGGMGRTTTMISYAMSLASAPDPHKRKRIAIIDCDLEAPGYLNFFNLSKHKGLSSGKKNGLVEFMCDAQFTSKPENLNIDDYMVNIGVVDNDDTFAQKNLDNIWLIPAGNLNESFCEDESSQNDRESYLEGLAKINLSNVQTVVRHFKILFKKIEEAIDPDLILIDSRTGFNDVFGTSALLLSQSVVGFFGFSRQTQPGLMNLLRMYYDSTNSFKLKMVFSILPENADEQWQEKHKDSIMQYISVIGDETKECPDYFYLHRNDTLEKIGTGDEKADLRFLEMIQGAKFKDYNNLFGSISRDIFGEQPDESYQYSANTPALKLRNVVLKNLSNSLKNVKNFAESTEIDENQFFYRECMKELFDNDNYLILGYKGTGKTYLYKALSDRNISKEILEWKKESEPQWGRTEEAKLAPLFINILPTDESALVFNNIDYSTINEPDYYFDKFWQIYTWNVLMLEQEFISVKQTSKLAEFIEPITGAKESKKALLRIDKLIKQGVETFVYIDEDLLKINDYLNANKKRLFILYDRLDSCINPLKWDKTVSPLIAYWRSNFREFSNIAPKIFIRTDLFRKIQGTNIARLEENIIHIEWSIGEVFAFFFKLIFSNPESSEAIWAIAEKVGVNADFIKNTKKSFEDRPKNQFQSMLPAEMGPLINIFFGKEVIVKDARLGKPWDYFSKELSSADRKSISLRPFINTMDANAVDEALRNTDKYVKNGIIPPNVYASKTVRNKTTESYFNDLTQDEFSKDLICLKEIITSSNEGKPFRYKSLTEEQYDDLLSKTFAKIVDSNVVKNVDELNELITANNIIAPKVTNKGIFYQFAPIYWYSWGLENSVLERDDFETKKVFRKLHDGMRYEGVIIVEDGKWKVSCDMTNFPLPVRDSLNGFSEGDRISFVAKSEDNQRNPNKTYWVATDIESPEFVI